MTWRGFSALAYSGSILGAEASGPPSFNLLLNERFDLRFELHSVGDEGCDLDMHLLPVERIVSIVQRGVDEHA